MSPLALAFVGDGVYEVLVRRMLVEHTRLGPNLLHRHTVRFVSAKGQCAALEAIRPMLTEAEQNVVRRGQNASKPQWQSTPPRRNTGPALPLRPCWAGCI